jgi:hypothetical protein
MTRTPIIDETPVNGATSAHHVSRELAKLTHHILLICCQTPKKDNQDDDDEKEERMTKHNNPRYLLFILRCHIN